MTATATVGLVNGGDFFFTLWDITQFGQSAVLIKRWSWVQIPLSRFHNFAVCLGGEEAVLKTVGRKRLAGSNPVYCVLQFTTRGGG